MQMLEKLDSLNRIGTKKDKEGGGCNLIHALPSYAKSPAEKDSGRIACRIVCVILG